MANTVREKYEKNGCHEFVLNNKAKPIIVSVPAAGYDLVKQNKINPSVFCRLEQLLKTYTVSWKSAAGVDSKGRTTNGRRGFDRHRSTTFGYVKEKCGNTINLSASSKKRPDIYEELINIGNTICPFKYSSIFLNNNVVSPRHQDSKNCGLSLLISFGDYTGGCINIETEQSIEKYDAKYNAIIFDGAKYFHWNDEITLGNKYSLVFFRIK